MTRTQDYEGLPVIRARLEACLAALCAILPARPGFPVPPTTPRIARAIADLARALHHVQAAIALQGEGRGLVKSDIRIPPATPGSDVPMRGEPEAADTKPRRRGGQPGNRNRLKHGCRSRQSRLDRLEAHRLIDEAHLLVALASCADTPRPTALPLGKGGGQIA